ncbi:hypothetical protein LI6934_10185 [Bacillus licheniformis LMG 6934]|nr:hypothetical protein LI6934_10185 [Bacillus licheniformis LMG 6934]
MEVKIRDIRYQNIHDFVSVIVIFRKNESV